MIDTMRLVFLNILVLVPFSEAVADNHSNNVFSPSLLLGDGYNLDNIDGIIKNESPIKDSIYPVDIFVNDKFIQREDVHFYTNSQSKVVPCLSTDWWLLLGVNALYIQPLDVKEALCLQSSQVEYSDVKFEFSKLRLSLHVPQAYLNNKARDYIDPERWQSGSSVLFVNYNGNYYHSSFDGNSPSESLFFNLHSGVNFGMWRLRNQSNYSYNKSNGDSYTDIESIRTYAARVIPNIMADFSLGELNTQSRKLSNLSYMGIQIQSDTKMHPNSQQGYAPVVSGIAKTSAQVVIKQKGQKIYQTSVAPGPFEITDLYPTSYQGDLEVEVIEANGQISTFTVPYASRPGALRLGQQEFSLSMGESQDYHSNNWLIDGSYKVGLSNLFTLNTDIRIADNYYAFGVGSVLNTSFGAFGTDLVYSLTEQSYDRFWVDGWRFGVDYSRTFDTDTTVTVAGYHYSTTGYRELSDVLNYNNSTDSNDYSSSYEQKEEMTVSVSQGMGRLGMVSFNGSKRTYRNGREDDDQFGLGYSSTFGPVSFNVNYSRQYTVMEQNTRQSENLWTASISLPLFSAQHMLTSGFTHSQRSGDSADIGLSGLLGEDKTLSYNLSASRQMPDSGNASNRYYLGVNKRTSVGAFGVNYTKGDNYTQYGANSAGSVVLHSGGINFAQSLGETFAVVHAPGAEGADVLNTYGQKVASNDYALVPNLIAYRENDILLGGEHSPYVEILSSGQKVVPMAGAAITIDVKTRKGYPLLINTQVGQQTRKLPIGAIILDSSDQEVGVVGQNGVLYARVGEEQGQLKVQWGREQCVVNYHISNVNNDAVSPRFFQLDSVCQ